MTDVTVMTNETDSRKQSIFLRLMDCANTETPTETEANITRQFHHILECFGICAICCTDRRPNPSPMLFHWQNVYFTVIQ